MDSLRVSLDREHSDQRLKVVDKSSSSSDGNEDDRSSVGSWCRLSVASPTSIRQHRRTVFFDLDNTLYSKSLGIHNQMADRIQLFMNQVLLLPKEESRRLSARYYLDYGLSVRGILNDFQIETAEYDRFVDGGLELEGLLRPSKALQTWISSIHASRWIFTNAGIGHTERVLGLLGIRDLFSGIIYCDYGEHRFPAKPERLAYERAMKCAGVTDPSSCYFIDDSANNVRVAAELGWKAVHFDEEDDRAFAGGGGGSVYEEYLAKQTLFPRVRDIMEFTKVYPELLSPEPDEVAAMKSMSI